MNNFRIYTKVKKIADDYYEVSYKEYNADERLVGTGTEDFSGARLKTATKQYAVFVYNGRINRADGKMTDHVATIRMSKNTVAIQAARMLYENVARVERWG